MFSIVIPLFNKEKRIKDTLQSILNQTYQDFEILVVNDGSTDRSAEIVAAMEDSRIHLFDQKNSGVSAARNKGIECATHAWVAFIDADDYWDSSFLEEMYHAISKYPGNTIFVGGTAVFKNSKFERSNNTLLPDDGQTGFVNFYKALSFNYSPINSSNVVIEKEHLMRSGLFKEGQRNYEDCDLWIRLCVHDPIVYINNQLSVYVKYDGESASKQSYLAKDCISMLNTYIEVKEKLSDADARFLQKFYINHCFTVLLRYYRNYTPSDKRKVISLMAKILPYSDYMKAKMIVIFRLSNTIVFAKMLKRQVLSKIKN